MCVDWGGMVGGQCVRWEGRRDECMWVGDGMEGGEL